MPLAADLSPQEITDAIKLPRNTPHKISPEDRISNDEFLKVASDHGMGVNTYPVKMATYNENTGDLVSVEMVEWFTCVQHTELGRYQHMHEMARAYCRANGLGGYAPVSEQVGVLHPEISAEALAAVAASVEDAGKTEV